MSNYSAYRCCAVIKCKNTSVKTPDKLWIRVPEKNINMRKTWFKIARRDSELLSKKTRLYFCENHFDVSMYLYALLIQSIFYNRLQKEEGT